MSLINCPECGREISDKAEACPHCGLPSGHFKTASSEDRSKEIGLKRARQWTGKIAGSGVSEAFSRESPAPDDELKGFDPREFRNALISFERDYTALFLPQLYLDTKSISLFTGTYEKYYKLLNNELILQYLRTKEVCDFMSNDREYLQDIYKCPQCRDGYMIVKRAYANGSHTGFYGCTNYSKGPGSCKNTVPFDRAK